jgi:hypothetical protein
MNTSEILMTDPTTEAGREYWEQRRSFEEWQESHADDEGEPIYELQPGLKRCAHKMRYTGHQCQLADGHVGRHAWEPAWVEHIAAIEAATALPGEPTKETK